MSFLPIMDDIREARRSDDPLLNQGAWVRELKQAQWPKVKDLCAAVLTEKSKDLQVAAWYAEAMTRLEGLSGLEEGLRLVHGLLTRFWDELHPSLEDGPDQRLGRLEWLEANLPLVVRGMPVTAAAAGGHTWLQWDEAVRTEGRGASGDSGGGERLTLAVFDKAVTASGAAFYAKLAADAQGAVNAMASLAQAADAHLGHDAPAFEDLKGALEAMLNLANNLNHRFVRPSASAPLPDAPTLMLGGSDWEGGPVTTRAQAIAQLREVAAYFRHHEPHSPVAPLVERAARWAAMDLESWLAEVVKDEGSLGQLRTLLDFQSSQG